MAKPSDKSAGCGVLGMSLLAWALVTGVLFHYGTPAKIALGVGFGAFCVTLWFIVRAARRFNGRV